ncbi:hypothetical protein B0H14DRAFT_1065366 [Mycena olivaceomarginata]|nr:hypothetical protein B0H14DRAFT_1065366 [Mycena olivaceomarginata]
MNNHGSGSQIHSSGIHLLRGAAALEALHDSGESFPQPKCHPDTRKELLDSLYHWTTDLDPASAIRWLHGPAGAGKSAVMQTLCEQLQDARRLGGSFFFKQNHRTRGNARVLFATLAFQLALHRPVLIDSISRTVERDPSVLWRNMDVQLRTLIQGPCKSLHDTTPAPIVFLIDGLDECEGHNIQREVLRLIGSVVNDRSVRLRILIASRPEPHIRETLEEVPFSGLVYPTNIEQSFEDIRTYLWGEFDRIHREHPSTMGNIPAPWPSSDIVEGLVQKSSGYFIYASTVVKFIDDEYSRPSGQLDIIIQNLVPQDIGSPFVTLDQLYLQILSRVPPRFHSSLCDILGVIIHYPQKGITVAEIDELLGFEGGQLSLILRPLHSVLSFPSRRGGIELHHASFHDFLTNEQRSSTFYVGSPQHHARLGCFILKALAYRHNDLQNNFANGFFRWALALNSDWIHFVTLGAPSVDLVPLIQSVNPDFLFCDLNCGERVEKVLFWLKEIQPAPKDLIQCWEDYRFIQQYRLLQSLIVSDLLPQYSGRSERIRSQVLTPSLHVIRALHSRMNGKFQAIPEALHAHLSQCPPLIRIFQARRLLFSTKGRSLDFFFLWELFQIRIVLDLSWDNIRGWICSLRPTSNRRI